MRIRTALLAMTSMVAAPSLAMASTITGPYVDLGAGYNLVQKQKAHYESGDRGRIKHGPGFNGYLSTGWGFGNGLRVEIEGTYNQTYNRRISGVNPSNTRRAYGRDQGYGGFLNVLYDIDLNQFGINSPVTPFVGIGAGYLWQQYGSGKHGMGVRNRPSLVNESAMKSTAGGFAAQAIVGAAYDIPGVPGLALTTQYRFIAQTGSNSGVNKGHYHNEMGQKVVMGTRYTHQFILGLRYAFNNAPPPPPPAPHVVVPPAPTAARTYLVFFDWDNANLTARARQIVAQAAQASTHVRTTRIEVNGYTDNSAAHPGPRGDRYNLGLSERRASSVKAELVRDGVPSSAISIHGYGDANPLVATAKNTREPQNRRVEIILK
ncbi:OmpA family protein [Saccharibacter sp. 17.LH.SD]|uniref:OmpA family protein n=1 Tax=Saccharibacter sp. 17.LH.SD TaxID=2689393 RepID=UPI0013713A61|nr:OmpA family protein [Saccharibacter sp. 17.LH.SD]MXV44068.1 OmpA family protein [Saccharibacter sp. 17.LH.SD]